MTAKHIAVGIPLTLIALTIALAIGVKHLPEVLTPADTDAPASAAETSAVGPAHATAPAARGQDPENAADHERQQYQNAYRLIEAAAKKHGIEPALAHAIALQGSFYNPKKISSEGALGLMQIRPTIAAGFGVTDKAALFDPEINVNIAMQHLRSLLAHHDVPGALYAYTTGRKPPEAQDGVTPEVTSLSQRIFKQYQLNTGR